MVTDAPSLQREISEWADATFGRSSSPLRIAVRANEELAELLRAIVCEEAPAKIAEEAADTAIILYRLAAVLEFEEESFTIGGPYPLSFRLALEGALAADVALQQIMVCLVDGRASKQESIRTFVWQALWCLHVTAARVSIELPPAIAAKLEVNKARDWGLDGTGHGYHP